MTYITVFKNIKTDTSFIFKDPGIGTNTISLTSPTLSSDYVFNLPVDTGTSNQILSTDGSGGLLWVSGGGGSTFQGLYDSSSPVSFTVNDTKDGLVIKDSATPITGDLFSVTNNAGTLKYINITSTSLSTDLNLQLTKTTAVNLTHTGGSGDLTIESTTTNVLIESITFNNGAMTGISTLGMTGDLTLSGGNILMTATTAQVITHTGSGGGNLTISSGSDIIIESVTFTGGDILGITTFGMTSTLTLTTGDIFLTKASTQNITRTSGGTLTISASSGDVIIESVTFNGNAVSGVTDIIVSSLFTITGSITSSANITISKTLSGSFNLSAGSSGKKIFLNTDAGIFFSSSSIIGGTIYGSGNGTSSNMVLTGGNILLTKSGNQLITKNTTGNLTIISSSGSVELGPIVVTTGALTGITTLDMTSTLTLTGSCVMSKSGDQSITKTTTGNFTISSSTGNVVIESVTFNGTILTGVSTLGMSGDFTNTGGNILLTNTGAQSIIHTGGDLSISGSLLIDSVSFSGGIANTTNTSFLMDEFNFTNKGSYTQTTSINTTVATTANSGNITTVSMAITSGSTETFNVTNSSCTTSSIVITNINYSGSGSCHIGVKPNTGSFDIYITNGSGTTLNAIGIISYNIF